MISEKKEALYLINQELYLHLKETVTATGFAYETFDKATGTAQHTGLITYEEMSERPVQSPIACARALAIQEIGLKCEEFAELSLHTLGEIKGARRAFRREHADDSADRSIRFITSGYDDLFRIPDGGTIQVDFPDRSFIAKCEYIDDYHLKVANDIFHICQFAEILERGGGSCRPEPNIELEEAAWDMGPRGFLAVQRCEDGWDYSFYDKELHELDGGQLDAPELSLQEARNVIAADFGWGNRSMTMLDYSTFMEQVEAREAVEMRETRVSALQQLKSLQNEPVPQEHRPLHRAAETER